MNLNELVAAREEQLMKCLQENIRIPSEAGTPAPGAPYGIACRKSLDHVLKTAAELGFKTCDVDGHVGWCEYGEGEEMIAVLGHLDVVPAGDGWSFDPWGGEIKDGKIFGRGTMDDKGPSIAALFALDALKVSGLPIRRRIRLIFGCDEETGAEDVAYYLAHGGEIPVMGFTPDAEFPVINGEKGIINAYCSRSYCQSGDLKIKSIVGGTASNVVPGYAKAELICPAAIADDIAAKQFEKITIAKTDDGILMEAYGENAHGSTPWKGENAIGRLILALNTLPFAGEAEELIGFMAEKLGMDTVGEAAGIHLWDEPSGDLSFNWGVLNMDEQDISLVINYRYPVTCSYDDCAPILQTLFENNGFTVTQEHMEKLYISADSELVQILMKVYKEQTGLDTQPLCIGGGTYAKCLPNILAFGPIFPGDEVREHKPDEFMEIPKIMKNAQIIASAMYELAK